MLRRKWIDPSAKSRLTPFPWQLEKSSRPPSASVVMLIQLLWASTRQGDGAPRCVGDGEGGGRRHVGRTEIHPHQALNRRRILNRLAEVQLTIEIVLLQLRQQKRAPAPARRGVGRAVAVRDVRHVAGRQ